MSFFFGTLKNFYPCQTLFIGELNCLHHLKFLNVIHSPLACDTTHGQNPLGFLYKLCKNLFLWKRMPNFLKEILWTWKIESRCQITTRIPVINLEVWNWVFQKLLKTCLLMIVLNFKMWVLKPIFQSPLFILSTQRFTFQVLYCSCLNSKSEILLIKQGLTL